MPASRAASAAASAASWRDDARTSSLPPFRRAVLELCASIPAGRASTYGALASVLAQCGGGGGRGSAQAVGSALHHNPFAPAVPCHRVLRAVPGGGASIGGFCGSREGSGDAAIGRKAALLAAEGLVFDGAGHLADAPRRLLGPADFAPAAVEAARACLRPASAKRRREPASL